MNGRAKNNLECCCICDSFGCVGCFFLYDFEKLYFDQTQ